MLLNKKELIYQSAKELFSMKGFKETNVAEITSKAGVGVGTFYNYYASKEKLFMEIFLEENEKLKRRILASVDLEAPPMQVMREVMMLNESGMRENPTLREWYNRESFRKVEELFSEESGLEAVDFLHGSFTDLVKKWQAEGKMRGDIDPSMIMAIFTAIINIDIHKEEIGIEYFPQLMYYMGEFVMRGLTECSGQA